MILGVLNLPDASALLSVATLILVLVFGPRYVRRQALQRRLEEANAVIDLKNQTISGRDEYIENLQMDIEGLRERADNAETKCNEYREMAAEWKARYEEQQQYTAEPALERLTTILSEMHSDNERWQTESYAINHLVMELLERITAANKPNRELGK